LKIAAAGFPSDPFWEAVNFDQTRHVTSCISTERGGGGGSLGYGNVTTLKRDKHKQYARYATYCLETAMAKDRGARTILREMAAEWMTLADAVLRQPKRLK
jgi:hypothetical protein